MCCFSRPVELVSNTNIFGRLTGKDTQYLVYQMKYESQEPNAMILPLPTPAMSPEDAVRFISLKDYQSFFLDLDSGFPEITPTRNFGRAADAAPGGEKLMVHDVGDYVASFVPTMKDFDRLDPRFVIPAETWGKIPGYADFGFVVFQLKELKGQPHPMAFEFATRWPTLPFFPTVHIHDGEVHEVEEFDHALYLQHDRLDQECGNYINRNKIDRRTGLERSKWKASQFCKIDQTQGIVNGEQLVHRKIMRGEFANEDIVNLIPSEAEKIFPKDGKNASWLPLWSYGAIPIGLLGMGWLVRRRNQIRLESKTIDRRQSP